MKSSSLQGCLSDWAGLKCQPSPSPAGLGTFLHLSPALCTDSTNPGKGCRVKT